MSAAAARSPPASPAARLKRSSPEPVSSDAEQDPRELIPLANIRRLWKEEAPACDDIECIACSWKRAPSKIDVEADLVPEVFWFNDELGAPLSSVRAGNQDLSVANGEDEEDRFEQVHLEEGLTYLLPRVPCVCEETTEEMKELIRRIEDSDGERRRPRVLARKYTVVIEVEGDERTQLIWRVLNARRSKFNQELVAEQEVGQQQDETPPYSAIVTPPALEELFDGGVSLSEKPVDKASIGRKFQHMEKEHDVAPKFKRLPETQPIAPLEDDVVVAEGKTPQHPVCHAGLYCYRVVVELPPKELLAAASGHEAALLSSNATALEVRYACEVNRRLSKCRELAAAKTVAKLSGVPWSSMSNMPAFAYARDFRTPDEEACMRRVREASAALGLCEHAMVYATKVSSTTDEYHIEVILPPVRDSDVRWDEACSIRARKPVDVERPTAEELSAYTFVLVSPRVELARAAHYTAAYFAPLKAAAEFVLLNCPFCSWVRRSYRCASCPKRLFYPSIVVSEQKSVLTTAREAPRQCTSCVTVTTTKK